MALIADFDGIFIYLYMEPNAPHHLPHFHARYAEHWAVYAIQPPIVLDGSLPQPQHRRVVAWAIQNADAIEEGWWLLASGRRPPRIK